MPSTRIQDGGLATYSYAPILVNPVAAATDLLMLSCPAGSKVKFRWIEIGGTAVALRQVPVSLIRRSSPTTGGTFTNPVPQKADPTDGPSQVGITLWSTLPGALGASLGTVDAGTYTIQTGAAQIQDRLIFNYEGTQIKPPTFGMNVIDYLCINMAGVATIATDKLDIELWWTEGG